MDLTQKARRITATLFIAQALGSAGIIAMSTVNPIVGAKLSGNPALAGAPAATFLFGGAFAALAWGYLMDRIGRRLALTSGMALGSVGTAVAGWAILVGDFWLYMAGLLLMGMGQSALALSRFTAAEVNPPEHRGRAISNVVLGGAVGAVTGPLLVGPLSRAAAQAGLDELFGPFVAGFCLLTIGALIIAFRLNPDPRSVGMEVARLYPETRMRTGVQRPILTILTKPGPAVAIASMAVSQLVMVLLMVMTSLHMKDHHHMLGSISLVMSSHTFGMFAFSLVSGRLADRWGREPVIMVGSATLLLACLIAPLSTDLLLIVVALFFLGLGWNFCYVGGSSLLSDQLSPGERARTQGFNDLLVGLSSAVTSVVSGLIYAAAGFAAIAAAGVVISTVLLALVFVWQRRRTRLVIAPTGGSED